MAEEKLYVRGDVIHVETPFVHILNNNQRGNRCDHCFLNLRSEGVKLLRCTGCNLVRYCNTKCQRNDWATKQTSLHKIECGLLKAVQPRVPSESARLMFRLMLLHKTGAFHLTRHIVGRARCLHDLMSHEQDIRQDPKRMKQFAEMVATLKYFVGEDFQYEIPETEELLDLFGKMVTNSFSVCDRMQRPIGVAIYIGASIIDHSCQPNCIAMFDAGLKLNIRCLTTEPITFDQIRISYIDQFTTTEKRNKQLMEQYYFRCDCPLCQDMQLDELKMASKCTTPECNGAIRQHATGEFLACGECDQSEFSEEYMNKKNTIVMKTEEFLDKIKVLKKEKGHNGVLAECVELLREQEEILYPDNVLYIATLDQAVDACIHLAQWPEAIEHITKTMHAYRLFYPEIHPTLGIQLMKLGKILLYLGQLPESLKNLHQADDIITVTHGRQHPLSKDLHVLIDQCQEEMRVQMQQEEGE